MSDSASPAIALLPGISRPAESPPPAGPVRVAVVVPTFRQPGLLAEAIDSALSQWTSFAVAIVLVNDGCPFDETDRVCREFAACHPGRIFYLNRSNGGLSAARNTGIDFALAAFPELEAIYFLDSDNRLHPHLLQRLYDALDTDAGIGWAYTDIDKFGFDEFCDLSGGYSPLEHLIRNVSDAGSMVSRRMIDAGARFDEAMRHGYEDWEFWLQGVELGFSGVHVPAAGFLYRQRGESMLREAAGRHEQILDYVRAKHPRLFGVRRLARLEAELSPRYGLVSAEPGQIRLLTDPGEPGGILPLDEFAQRLIRAGDRPGYGRCPGLVLTMPPPLVDLLARHRLLGGVLWTLERAAARATIVTCRVMISPAEECRLDWEAERLHSDAARGSDMPGEPQIVALWSAVLSRMAEAPDQDAFAIPREPWREIQRADLNLRLALPDADADALPDTGGDAFGALREAIGRAVEQHDAAGWDRAVFDRHRAGTGIPGEVYQRVHRLPSVLPVAPRQDRRQAAIVLRPDAACGTRAVAWQLAQEFRREGADCHLVAMGEGAFAWRPAETDVFVSIVHFPSPLLAPARTGGSYNGAPVPAIEDQDYAIGTLAPFARVVVLDHPGAFALAGALRRLGVETWAALCGNSFDPPGRLNLIAACTAFEHAFDRVLASDDVTRGLCLAMGIPGEKLRCPDDPDQPSGLP